MKIYIVDDDKSIRDSLRDVLEDEDFQVEDFANGKTMLKALDSERPALVLLDVWLGKEDGLELIDKIKAIYPLLPVLMISGHGTIEQAVVATKKGAVDFLEKPISLENILAKISEILEIAASPGVTSEKPTLKIEEIIGESRQIVAVKIAIERAAKTNARVFIYGENGSGKELVAKAIYKNSKRFGGPFVEVNCAAIPEELIESELFGYEKGSFTGATEQRIGKFEKANGGTLFLDEICDMSLATQASVLRAIQEQRFTRVGGTENINVDVRIIAATNILPEEAIKNGRFREDLYYRLNVIPINMPPLRDRKDDIPGLLDLFIRETVKEHQIEAKKFTPGAKDYLKAYAWPGNVRELKNFVERICIMCPQTLIDEDTVQNFLKDRRTIGEPKDIESLGNLRVAREEFEKKYILQALKMCENNVSRAAKFLGLERTNLHRKMKLMGIDLSKIE